MTDLEKLEFIHHAIQEAMREYTHEYENELLTRALSYVEDLREPHLQEYVPPDGNPSMAHNPDDDDEATLNKLRQPNPEKEGTNGNS